MFERIIFGDSGDRAGRDAAVLANELAGVDGSQLEVVHPYHPFLSIEPWPVAELRVRDRLRELLGDSRALSGARYRWSSSSWPIRALHELADYDRCGLMVVGAAAATHHVGLMGRMVHAAPCAVAIAPAGYAEHERLPTFKSIGVGFADTEEGRSAIRVTRQLAEHAGAHVRVIACSGLSAELLSYAGASPALPAAEAELYEATRDAATRVCQELPTGCDYELDVRRGEPCRLLVKASEELDLLVLGSRACGPLRSALLGGVSAAVMERAHCPLLVTPRGVRLPAAESGLERAALGR